jgi:hypothetical protein
VDTGSTASFWVVASGTGTFTYQWSLNGTAISGATGPLCTVTGASSANAGNYTVTVTNTAGSATSQAATLTVNSASVTTPIAFALEPLPQSIAFGGSVVFYAPAIPSVSPNIATARSPDAAETVTYQWFLNDVAIASATGSTYVISGATAADNGSYTCVATDSSGSVVSTPATLNVVTTSNPGRLTNLSCRANSEAGANELIAGYEIGGQGTSGSLPVLVRASGPALAGFGVPGTLPDPELTLDQSVSGVNQNVATNAGWGGTEQLVNAAASVGAFAWSSATSKDSALYVNLGGGAYTAQVTGVSNDSGVALAEVYDATPSGSYTLSSPRLTNISARVEVGTGGNILIAGFEISGTTSKTVLIRASGPVLKNFGLTGVLPDPELSLYQSVAGVNTLLQTNTGWGENPQIATAAGNVGAFSWGTTATADSAILVTLPPGAYTAEEAGASGDTGIGLIEVYEVP